MPSGYTADIANGISFDHFVMRCARAFGALVEMRDAPYDATIPEKFEPSDYHKRGLEAAQKALANLYAMSATDRAEAMEAKHVEAENNRLKILAEKNSLREKYEAMLRQVRSWIPPTKDHDGIKSFMIEQINSSIQWDCDCSSYEKPTERMTHDTWMEEERKRLQWQIDYHKESHAKEVSTAASRTAWVKALRDSLKDPP